MYLRWWDLPNLQPLTAPPRGRTLKPVSPGLQMHLAEGATPQYSPSCHFPNSRCTTYSPPPSLPRTARSRTYLYRQSSPHFQTLFTRLQTATLGQPSGLMIHIFICLWVDESRKGLCRPWNKLRGIWIGIGTSSRMRPWDPNGSLLTGFWPLEKEYGWKRARTRSSWLNSAIYSYYENYFTVFSSVANWKSLKSRSQGKFKIGRWEELLIYRLILS